MRRLIFILMLFAGCCEYATAVYWNINARPNDQLVNVGEPLFLTELIEKGQIADARKKARVNHPALKDLESYAGYLTVDKLHNSNTFFWFFPSQRNPKSAPVVLWFIGGPGLSGLITLFDHNGPVEFTSEGILESRNYSLTTNHSVIYIDNPVGAGFSYTLNDLGYARNQTDVARNVLSFLSQFFQLFSDLKQNEFYIGGDSYGGKFVVSVSNAIRLQNKNNNSQTINLKGLILGSGLIDFATQTKNSEYLYQLGIVDKIGRKEVRKFETNENAANYPARLELQTALTGFTYFSNILYFREPSLLQFTTWVERPDFRKAVHVGHMRFNLTSDYARDFFENPFQYSLITEFENLLSENYRILTYSGQLDAMFPYVSNENLFEKLNWPGALEYAQVERKQWWLDGELAGYVKGTPNFVSVLIRNSGHVPFLEQPKWTSELVSRFTQRKPIVQEKRRSRLLPKSKYIFF